MQRVILKNLPAIIAGSNLSLANNYKPQYEKVIIVHFFNF